MSNEKWPNTLVLPDAKDFCIGSWDNGKQCCLVGWANIAFGPKDLPRGAHEEETPEAMPEDRLRARNRFLAEVVRVGSGGTIDLLEDCLVSDEVDYDDDGPVETTITVEPLELDVGSAVCWNDNQQDEKVIAAAWRKAARKFGYDVTNPVIIK